MLCPLTYKSSIAKALLARLMSAKTFNDIRKVFFFPSRAVSVTSFYCNLSILHIYVRETLPFYFLVPGCFCSAGGISVWAISPEERSKHDQKFDTLSPAMGFVSGTQTRTAAQTAGFYPGVPSLNSLFCCCCFLFIFFFSITSCTLAVSISLFIFSSLCFPVQGSRRGSFSSSLGCLLQCWLRSGE